MPKTILTAITPFMLKSLIIKSLAALLILTFAPLAPAQATAEMEAFERDELDEDEDYSDEEDIIINNRASGRRTTASHFFGLEDAVRVSGEIERFIDDDTFIMQTGTMDLAVNIMFLDIDDEELRFLRNSDEVVVYAPIEEDFFNNQEIDAEILYLREGSRSILFE